MTAVKAAHPDDDGSPIVKAPRLDSDKGPKRPKLDKKTFDMPMSDYWLAAGTIFSLSLIGMGLWPVWVITFAILVNRFKMCREEFLLVIGIILTQRAFIPEAQFHFNPLNPVMLVTVLALLVYRRDKAVKRIMWVVMAYIFYLFLMATKSIETLGNQRIVLMQYCSVLLFIMPLFVMSNHKFDIQLFYRKAILYFIVICVFYAIDGFILRGAFFVPSNQVDGLESTIDEIYVFLKRFPRKYPHGMYSILITVYPIARYYKLKPVHWVLILVGMGATYTMTLFGSALATLVIFQGQFKKVAKWCVLGVAVLLLAYFIDKSTGKHLRLATTIEQFTSLQTMVDEEDLAEFGSSRMAQIIPKMEAMVDNGYLATGVGFLSNECTVPAYTIYNSLYINPSKAVEPLAYTEVSLFNTFLATGLIGLFVQLGFYFLLFFLVRGYKDSALYLSTLCMSIIISLGGSGGLNQLNGVLWVAFALGIILLEHRRSTTNDKRLKVKA